MLIRTTRVFFPPMKLVAFLNFDICLPWVWGVTGKISLPFSVKLSAGFVLHWLGAVYYILGLKL